MTNFNPGTVWLITHRTRPAWTAALHLLDDDEWHPIELVTQAMRDTADLAPRTIENHIRSATRRGWITRRGHQVRLRDRDAIETALEAADPMDGA